MLILYEIETDEKKPHKPLDWEHKVLTRTKIPISLLLNDYLLENYCNNNCYSFSSIIYENLGDYMQTLNIISSYIMESDLKLLLFKGTGPG